MLLTNGLVKLRLGTALVNFSYLYTENRQTGTQNAARQSFFVPLNLGDDNIILAVKGDFMSATITIPIDVELQSWLAQKASARGIEVEQYAAETLRRAAQRPTINEAFVEERAAFEANSVAEEPETEPAPQPTTTPARLQAFLQAMAAGSETAPVLPPEADERAFYYEGEA